MARAELDPLLSGLHGSVVKHGAIHRKKKLHDSKGRVIKECKEEVYEVVNRRDYQRNPKSGREREHHEMFTEAIRRTNVVLSAMKAENNPTEEQLAELHEWQERFDAQVPGRNSHADSEAPIDEKTGKQKRYYQLNTFVRAIMFQRIKAERAAQGEAGPDC